MEPPPSPVLGTMGGLVGRICRIAVGLQPSVQAAAFQVAVAAAIAAAQVQASQQSTLASAKPKAKTVNLSLTTQQGSEEEAPLLPEAMVVQGFKNYFTMFKATPPSGRRDCLI